jgi:hypothetical protein
MSRALEELVDALGQIRLEAQLDEPEQLKQLMAEREQLLTAIQSADVSQLSQELRATLKERLHALLARDAALLDELALLRDAARAALEQLAPARAAVRGYGDALSASAPGTRRIG